MYFIIETNETVRVPPEHLGEEYETTAKSIAVRNVEGKNRSSGP